MLIQTADLQFSLELTDTGIKARFLRPYSEDPREDLSNDTTDVIVLKKNGA